jgi:CDP-paratose 2-epimerase
VGLVTRLLVTGGAGFVGSNLAIALAGDPNLEVLALDNLHRRGSELNLPRLAEAGVEFLRGDMREPDDLGGVPRLDAIAECSAEPSVMSGAGGDTSHVLHTNLTGAYNCLELARRDGAGMVFLSTSRVYPVAALESIRLDEGPTRFRIAERQELAGVSPGGISERFPTGGARTLYGATKLSAELLIEEYRASFGIPAVIDRCGVIAGPWQMGKVDQGVFTHWMLSHHFAQPLRYIGYGGSGKQVRDLIHIDDLVELVKEQLSDLDRWDGLTLNVGGGTERSLSLLETTGICRALTGNEMEIEPVAESRKGDVPLYISDCRELFRHTEWRPRRSAEDTMRDIHAWIVSNEDALPETLGVGAARR